MATIATEEKRCAVCGKTSVQGFVADAGRQGSADLDLRPPPDQRETIAHWVQECPHCGYCGVTLEEPTAGAAEVMASEEYRAIREEPGNPGLVVRLLCASTLLEHAERWVEAAETALWAAWAADDAGEDGVRSAGEAPRPRPARRGQAPGRALHRGSGRRDARDGRPGTAGRGVRPRGRRSSTGSRRSGTPALPRSSHSSANGLPPWTRDGTRWRRPPGSRA